jgi:hypothetical protein
MGMRLIGREISPLSGRNHIIIFFNMYSMGYESGFSHEKREMVRNESFG